MRRIVAALIVAGGTLALAAAANAQIIIDGDGPLAVESDDTSSTFTALVTCNWDFEVNLKVYHNGTLKYNHTTPVTNSGPTYNYSEVVSHVGWGLAVGDTLLYRAKATITRGPDTGAYDTDNLSVTVSEPSLPKVDGRREWAWNRD